MTDAEFKELLYRYTGYKQPKKQVEVLKQRGIKAELNHNNTVGCLPEWIIEHGKAIPNPVELRPRPQLQPIKKR